MYRHVLRPFRTLVLSHPTGWTKLQEPPVVCPLRHLFNSNIMVFFSFDYEDQARDHPASASHVLKLMTCVVMLSLYLIYNVNIVCFATESPLTISIDLYRSYFQRD